MKIGGGGSVTGLVTSESEPNLRYARTEFGGAYRWDENEGEWIPLLDWVSEFDQEYFAVESLAIDEQDPSNVYVLAGIEDFPVGQAAILRSSDYGETFSVVSIESQFQVNGFGHGRQNGERLQVDPNNSNILYCGTRHNGLFKSVDAGLTWTRLGSLNVLRTDNGNGISVVVLDPSSVVDGVTQTLFVGVSRFGENLYRSDDAGQSFTLVSGRPTDHIPQRAVLASDGALYIAYGNGAGPSPLNDPSHEREEPYDSGGIWKYDTSQNSWEDVTPEGMDTPFGGVSVDPQDPNRLVASTINTSLPQGSGQFADRFFLSTNGGASWTDVVDQGFDMDPNGVTWLEDKDQAIQFSGSIQFDPFDTSRVFVTSTNGIFRADDIDASTVVWTSNVEGLEGAVPLGLVSINGGPLISVIDDYDGFRHSDLRDYAPIHRPRIGTTSGLAAGGVNSDVVVRVGGNYRDGGRMFISNDHGLTWDETASIVGSGGQVAVSADGSVILHSPAFDIDSEGSLPQAETQLTYRSTDSGASWTTVTGLQQVNARPIADPVNPDKFYVYDIGIIRVSVDGGSSFSPGGSLGTFGSDIVRVVPSEEGHLWVALFDSGLLRSVDSGSTFSTVSSVEYCEAVGTGKAAEGADYATIFIWGRVDGVTGIFRSTDEGASWTRINDDAHQYGGPGNARLIVGDENVFGRVYMSTYGRGIVIGSDVTDSVNLDTWRSENFSVEELANEAIAGLGADPDRDGLANVFEWILLKNPKAANSLVDAVYSDGVRAGSFEISMLANIRSVEFSIEVSRDLVEWLPVESVYEPSADQVSEDGLLRSTRYELREAETGAAYFIRLKSITSD